MKPIYFTLIFFVLSIPTGVAQSLKSALSDYPELTKLFVFPCGIDEDVDSISVDRLKERLIDKGVKFKALDLGSMGTAFRLSPKDLEIGNIKIESVIITIGKGFANVYYKTERTDEYEQMAKTLENYLRNFEKIDNIDKTDDRVAVYHITDCYGIGILRVPQSKYAIFMLMNIKDPQSFIDGKNLSNIPGSNRTTDHIKRYDIILMSAAVLLLAIIIIGVIIIIKKSRSHKSRMNAILNTLETTSRNLTERGIEVENLKKLQSGYIRKINKQLDNMIYDYHKSVKESSEKTQSILRSQIDKYIESIKSPRSVIKIKEELRLINGNVVDKIMAELPRHRKDDLFITLLLSGFSPKSICLICDLSLENYYTKKSRLTNKLIGLPDNLKNQVLGLINQVQ